jgi:hypothetical protein
MKIRIKGNSVRIRLSKAEVEKLGDTGYIEEHACFGSNRFVYALRTELHANELSASFDEGKITMYIPASFIKDWAVNEVVGFEGMMAVSHAESLQLLVEKDFQCLDQTIEDQSDNYENPNKICQV